jgi:hypothetical protein
MAQSKNNLPKLVNRLPGAKSTLPSTSLLKPGGLGITGVSSITASALSAGLNFGKPSNSRSSSSTSGSSYLSSFLQQAATGGVASALGGSLGGLTGIGSLVAGFVSLFSGEKATLPPLVQFQAPLSQDQISYVGARTTVNAPSNSKSTDSTGVSGSANQPSATPYRYQSDQIAQAVKQALLNSSSLNDVIAEL